MKQLPYPSRRRHLPVITFLACVSWLWLRAPASADQTLGAHIELRVTTPNSGPNLYLIEDEVHLAITEQNIIFASGFNLGYEHAMFFDKSGGGWKCNYKGDFNDQGGTQKSCVAIKVINAGRFFIDYTYEASYYNNILQKITLNRRDQLQFFLSVTTSSCQIELVSAKYKLGDTDPDTIATGWQSKSRCFLL